MEYGYTSKLYFYPVEEEVEKKRRISLSELKEALKIYRFIKPYKGTFAIGSVFLVLSSLTALAFPFVIGELVDSTSSNLQGQSNLFQNLSINEVALVLLVILVLQAIFSYMRVILFATVSEKGMANAREELYNKMITMPIPFFEERRVGELVSRITNDVTQLQDTISTTLAEFLRQIATLLIGIPILFWLSSKLTLVMLATYPGIILVAVIFGRFIRKLSKETQDALADTNVRVDETLQAIHVVKAFANELFEIGRYRSSMDKVVHLALKAARYRAAFISFIIFGLFGGIVLVLWYGVRLVDTNEMTVGKLTSFVMYTVFIGGSLGSLGDIYAKILKTIGATERINDILEEESEVDTTTFKALSLIGKVRYTDVAFNYPSRPEVEVLKSLSFQVEPGQVVALVGPSGAGKSTIVQLLMSFYPVGKGSITIDDKELSGYDKTALRKHIGIVPQEVILFGGTIRENIAYGKPEATDAEIIVAAEQANARDFIDNFPEGLDTLVGERGIKLSGGQKQRVAIARAILKDPRILILDEATSSLDSESEKLVQDALNRLMTNRTTIVIAHRLSTIRNADKILVIENGVIAEEGTHEELMTKSDGLYNHLVELQFEGQQAS